MTGVDMRAMCEKLRRGVIWSDGEPIGAVVGAVNNPLMTEAADYIEAMNDAAVEAQMRAHQWMQAHDKLAAGKPYKLPSPADLPDYIERLLADKAQLREHFEALDRIVTESIVETGQPDRVRWEGVWYDGPLATAFLSLMRAVQKLSRTALTQTEQPND